MNKNIILLCFAIFCLCLKIIAQPTITSFSPVSGPVGTIVTITGSNFNAAPTNNIVFFGASIANVTSANDSSLTVAVPSGATFQYISVTDTTTHLTAYSSRPFIITFGCHSHIDSTSFAPKVDFTVGHSFRNILLSDINNDGKSDLILFRTSSQSAVSVFKNTTSNGIVSFDSPVSVYSYYDFSGGLTIVDLNGDGKQDIVNTNGDSSVSVSKNISTIDSISFEYVNKFYTENGASNIVVNDLDGDGKPDMLVSCVYDTVVSFFKNIGSGDNIVFAPRIDFKLAERPHDLATADLNGDDKPDIVIANTDVTSITVLKNTSTTGNISFATNVEYFSGTGPYSIAIGDIDDDGKPDIAVSNGWDFHASVLENTSIGDSISFAPKIDYTATSGTNKIAFNDIDGDGKLDMVISDRFSGKISIYENTSTFGNISFSQKINFGANPYVNSFAVGDIEGDGKPDITFLDESTDKVSLLINQVFEISTPEICMVTVDSLSTHNIIYWDKTIYTDVDSFFVYREIANNIYKIICALPYDSLSLFADTVSTQYFPNTGNPNAGTYKYKLQIRDTCGNYSPLSPYHKTIYINQTGGTFSFNDYAIEGQALPVSQLNSYLLFRDDISNGNWHVLNSVTSSPINDPDYAQYPHARWRVETDWSISCTPTKSINSSRSNIKGQSVGIFDLNATSQIISIYPNPFTSQATVTFTKEIKDADIYITDIVGKVVKTINISGKRVIIEKGLISSGIYFLQVVSENEIFANEKIIIE